MQRLKPLGALTVLAVVAASTLGLLTIVRELSAWATAGDLRDYIRLHRPTSNLLTWDQLIEFPLVASLVVAYVATCLWLARARANSLVLKGGPAQGERSGAWVWIGWWLPIVSLVMPYHVVRDVWQASVRGIDRREAHLGLWWSMWIGGGISAYAASVLRSNAGLTLDDVTTMLWLHTAAALAALVGFYLWVRIVLDVSRAQDAAARALMDA